MTNTKNNGLALQEFVSQLTPQAKAQLLLALQGKQPRLNHPGEGVERWEAAMRRRLKPNTIALYKRTICEVLGFNCITVFDTPDKGLTVKGKPREGRFHLEYEFNPEAPIPDSDMIDDYLDNRATSVTMVKVRNDYKGLRSFWDFLEKKALWPDNPMKTIEAPKAQSGKRKPPSKEAMEILLTADYWQGRERTKDRLILSLLITSGGRIGEIVRIETANVNLERRRITTIGKGSKARVLRLTPQVAEALGEYITKRLPLERSIAKNPDSPYLFPCHNEQSPIESEREQKIGFESKRNFERKLATLCRHLGIEKIVPHQLRHHFATERLRNGDSISLVSKLLGHARIATTVDNYQSVDEEELQEDFDRFPVAP
jgi:integrase/recombinase XerD